MALKGVIRGVKNKPPRVVLYGPPGIGKSTFGSDAVSPIMVTTEDGVDNLNVDQYPKAETWDAFMDNVNAVATGEHEYKTLVIDTLNGAAELCSKVVCERDFAGEWTAEKGKRGFNGFAAGWTATSEEMVPLMVALDKCRNERGMMVLLLAHVGLHSVSNPISGDYTKHAPEVDKRVWGKWSKWSDIILRADFDYRVEPGESGKKGRVRGDNQRVVYTAGDAAQDAKTRAGYELPDTIDLSYSAFMAALGSDNESLTEITELWVVLDKTQETKALAYLGVSSVDKIADADLTKVRSMLNRLRKLSSDKKEVQ